MTKALTDYTYEELAGALYKKGKLNGYLKVTDKTKWRELVLAEKLGHTAHKKISAGKDSENYGSDATDSVGRKGEYKTMTLEDAGIRNIAGHVKNAKTGTKFAPLKVSGVYNGAYNLGAIAKYSGNDHYFGIFHEEICVQVLKLDTKEVISQLTANCNKRRPGATTNCNTVTVGLDETNKYTTVYRNDSWFAQHVQ
jgi:hypothetical protein